MRTPSPPLSLSLSPEEEDCGQTGKESHETLPEHIIVIKKPILFLSVVRAADRESERQVVSESLCPLCPQVSLSAPLI